MLSPTGGARHFTNSGALMSATNSSEAEAAAMAMTVQSINHNNHHNHHPHNTILSDVAGAGAATAEATSLLHNHKSLSSANNHITIDLSQKRVETALAILRQRKRRKKVASALVHTKSCRYGRISYDGKTSNPQLFVRVFEALTDFPKLKHLAVEFEELETYITLPVACLLLILTLPKTRLKTLSFSNVRFAGDESDMKAWADAIQCHPTLAKVSFHRCAGETASLDPILQALARVPTMRHVELQGTRIRANDPYALDSLRWDGTSLVQLCQAPSHVRCLILQDVPDIGNRHVAQMAQGLASAKSKLRSLSLSSIRLGDSAGVALMAMLEVNRQLTHLTLDFDFGLITCGQAIADALKTNVHLQSLSLNLSSTNTTNGNGGNGEHTTTSHSSAVSWSSASSQSDDDDDDDDDEDDEEDNSERQRQRDMDAIDANVALMAKALRDNTSLRHFKLCLDLDDYTNFQALLLDESMAAGDDDNNMLLQDDNTQSRGSNYWDGSHDSSTWNYLLPGERENDDDLGGDFFPNHIRRGNNNNDDDDDSVNINNTMVNQEDSYHKITQAFEELLVHYNHTLYSLELNDGMYEWKNFQARIEFYLKLNRAGIRPLLQQENATKEQWVQAMEAQTHDINVLYYLLSRNPSLCCDTFGHVRDSIVLQSQPSMSLVGGGDNTNHNNGDGTTDDSQDAKKLSWWKRGKHKRKRMLQRLAPSVFQSSFASSTK